MAAVWPGKEQLPVTAVRGDEWKVTYRTRMPAPCNKAVTSSYTARKMDFAIAEANRVLTRAVKAHINGCDKCKANGTKAD